MGGLRKQTGCVTAIAKLIYVLAARVSNKRVLGRDSENASAASRRSGCVLTVRLIAWFTARLIQPAAITL
jgi:hypothetical protein